MASLNAVLAYGGFKVERSQPRRKAKAKKYEANPSECNANAESPLLQRRQSPLASTLLREYEEAIRRRDFQRVLWAIANGDANADHETRSGENAVLAAVAAKDGDALRMLVGSGVSIDSSNQKGYTPLMKAIAAAAPFAEAASVRPVGVLLLSRSHRSAFKRQRREPAAQKLSGRSSSSSSFDVLATSRGDGDESLPDDRPTEFDNNIVTLVLQLKPDVLKRDALGRTAFDWARRTGNAGALQLLEAYHHATSLHNAATCSREQRVADCRALLARHDECVAALESGFLAKHRFDEAEFVGFLRSTVSELPFEAFAAAVEDLRAAHVLPPGLLDSVQAAYVVNHESHQGWTPLTKAAANGSVAAVQVLLELGASMHHETRLRHTALTWASYCGHEAVVLHLLRVGVDVNQQTQEGKTALMHAASNAQATIVRHLLLALRGQSYPAKAKDAFDSELTVLNRRKSTKSAWKRAAASAEPIENKLEWHETFSNLVHCRDRLGKSALEYAEDAAAHGGPASEAAQAVLRALQHALHDAQEHLLYVERNEERTRRTRCQSPGCTFVGSKDTMAVHEQHQCLKRTVQCDACAAAIVFESQSEHDRVDCAVRRVACGNAQHGCHVLVLWNELETHMAHHCRKRVLACRRQCGRSVVFDELMIHENAQCPLRTVECELGCPATFLANEGKAHRRQQCPKRLVACTGGDTANAVAVVAAPKRTIDDGRGCGALVAADKMAFHLAHLCEKRKLACRWAINGCEEAIGGCPASRDHHEQRECSFRPVRCRNGCALSDSILHCFAREHYAWQCELEPKTCPHGCEAAGAVLSLPALSMLVHVLEDAGDCPKRLTRCPLDLCGKTIVLLGGSGGSTQAVGEVETSEPSLRALRLRVAASQRFLDRLRPQSSDAPAAPEESWEPLTRDATKRVLVEWLGGLQNQLDADLARAEEMTTHRQVQCRVLAYADERHLLEFADGRTEWTTLQRREFDVLLPPTPAAAAVIASGGDSANPTTAFQCLLIRADAVAAHVESECRLRLVPCPLGCAQRLPLHGVSSHTAKRCSMRNASCRLGCGAVMPHLSLGEHEESACALRSVFCQHCHEATKWQALESHLDRVCAKLPRRCRLGCSTKVAWSDVSVHESSHCPKRLVQCASCEKAIWFSERRAHEAAECPLREYGPCDAKCGAVLKHNEVGHHLLFACAQRVVTCSSCDQRVVFAKLAEHKALLCPQRLVRCRRGCGALLRDADTDAHEDDACAKRLVFCRNKCGVYVPCRALDAHLELACEMRVIECPSGCQEKLLAYQFGAHWKRCRQRLCPCGAGAKACARPIRLWYAGRTLVRCASHGENALLWALKAQDEDLVTYLLQNVDAAATLQEEFANGFAPLSMAVSLGDVEGVKTLLRFGADVNLETSRGRTALAEACLAQHEELVELLLEQRANVSHTNRQGRNLLATVRSLAAAAASSSDDARDSRWAAIVRLLEEREAIEREQRALFVAIACSDYEYLAQFLRFSAASTRQPDQLTQLCDELREQATRVQQASAEHADAIRIFNESVADTEAKVVHVSNLSEQVLDCTSQIARVDAHHDASLADSSALEAAMHELIREITAHDIAKLLNLHVPPDACLAVTKAICMISGVLPRGRHNAAEYTDTEWWKAAQALLMDRTLLQRLRGYRKSVVTPDVMAKVRRECLRTPGFLLPTSSFQALESTTTAEDTPNSVAERKALARLPPVEALRGNIVTLLAAWVKGVEMEYKSRAERQTLGERKRRLAVSLSGTRETLQQAEFDMHVATRSLPARQEEVEAARRRVTSEEKALVAAQQRLKAFRILTFSALNGHTPLSFAAAVGNEAVVHMLLTHGARAGYAEEEQHLCASLVQLVAREFLQKRRLQRRVDASEVKARSDAAVDALVRNVALAFLLSHFRRKILSFRQTHRVALHEAIFNGFPQIAEILLANDARLWHKTHVVPVRVFPGAVDAAAAEAGESLAPPLRRPTHSLSSGWTLTPLGDDDPTASPMLPIDTLELAMRHWDCKTFRKGRGWDPDATRYSDTHAFVTAALATLEDALQQRRQAIAARKSVAKKAAELKSLHTALEAAILARDFGAVSELLDRGAYADFETSRDGQSALMAACVEEVYVANRDKRDVLAVEFLLDRPTNHPFVNFESSTGRTALSTAARHGSLLCAQVLLDRGASVNQASRRHGRTALMAAAANGKTDFVQFLVEQPDVDVFATDAAGETAFAHAQARGFDDAMHVLGAAMAGNRGRFYASASALYGVCKWGCGFMANVDDHKVRDHVVLERTHPLARHETHGCPKRLVACPLACGSAGIWAEALPTHLAAECRLRVVPCSQAKCGASFAYERLAAHSRDECAFRTVRCGCGELMTHQKHVVHAQSSCPVRRVTCPLGCGAGGAEDAEDAPALRFVDLKTHQSSECPNRRVRCRNGCSASDLRFSQRGYHERHACSLRRVPCTWGCDEPVLANAQLHHEREECLRRQLPCPNKCGQRSIVVLDLPEHVADHCARRLVVCALGCGRKVPLHMMESHVAGECRKRLVACELCGQQLEDDDRSAHQSASCSQRISLCGLCGQANIPLASLATHRAEQCRMRPVQCKHKCFVKLLLAHEKERHESSECALRPIWCPLGCREVLVANTLKKHERVCIMRFVQCSLGCGAELREKDRARHELADCSNTSSQRGRNVRNL
ncbi:hypothetical protein PybrP1_012782 [[Pythium] brassicae (nom. inval.)]|nr:hypothetical protein PybrP1_012782 [[Pythium] brassicae (nom. inval.)]